MADSESELLLGTSGDFRSACGVLSHTQDTPTSGSAVNQTSTGEASEQFDLCNASSSNDESHLESTDDHKVEGTNRSLDRSVKLCLDLEPEDDPDISGIAKNISDVKDEESISDQLQDEGCISDSSPATPNAVPTVLVRRNPFNVAAAGSRPNYGAISGSSATDSAVVSGVGSIQRISAGDTDGDSYLASPSDMDGEHFGLDDITVLQACVFLEDAIEYRSIHHRVDKCSLNMYRIYYSKPIQWLLYAVLLTLHLLAFFETPSSLTATSDVRYRGERVELPCGATEAIELLCLVVLAADLFFKSYLKGKAQFLKSKWLWASTMVLLISFADWSISVGMLCTEMVRVRRMLRPFFLLQNSSLMKKTVNCLRKTLPHVVSVLLLLFLHLYFFTLFGMLIFPNEIGSAVIRNQTHDNSSDQFMILIANIQKQQPDERGKYFRNPVEAFLSLLVLLTTANNPDVTMPAYSTHRLYAIFFIIYLVIGLYCLMNMLTAVIYNQFRGYFTDSIQSSLFRRRLGIRAMYEVLRRRQVALRYSSSFATLSQGVPFHYLQQMISQSKIPHKYVPYIDRELRQLPGRLLDYQQVQTIFSVLDNDTSKKSRPQVREKTGRYAKCFQHVIAHKYFNYLGCLVAGINVICITLELGLDYERFRNSRNTYLGILNLLFVVYFCVEQCMKVWALGWICYAFDTGNLMDGIITILLVLAQGIYVAIYGIPFWGSDVVSDKGLSLWDLVRIINILIMIRLLRMIISQIKAMSIVSSTLFDLVKNLRAFAGILVVIYYSYALLGMELFHGVITYDATENSTVECGSYRQLQYWANNFDDFAAALMVLWDVMVVNNWHVFLVAYKEATTGWSQLYFIFWWLLSVVISLNLFTALILENFIMRWDRQIRAQTLRYRQLQDPTSPLEESFIANQFTVHDMFRGDLQEPSEEALIMELRHHPHFDVS